ncbi:MAG TPA: LPS export ABC transporter permease LptG [Burkholderiales bacterium]|jgi:lipopolysaccharide export system permease protein|nr:LPS export ABC transporter permease LptG [Burkholderiales bacterium]
MKIIRRYLAREIYASTTLVLVAFLGLFAFFDLIHELGDIGKGSYQLQHAALFVLLTVPGHVYELMPIAALIGTVYALAQLASHSEITVMRVSGLSTPLALRAVATIGLTFVAITFLFGELVAPVSERAAQTLRIRATSSSIAQEFRSGLWVRDEGRFVNVGEVRPDTKLLRVKIYEFDKEDRLRSISYAAEGEYLPPNKWRLTQVQRTVFTPVGTRLEAVPEMEWSSELNPDILSVLLVQPDKMSIVNLYLYIRHLSENRQKVERYEIALWKKAVYPMAVLVMMMLALPFAYMQVRAGGISLKIFAGIMLGLLFHLLNNLFAHLGAINTWPPFLSAVVPSVMFLLLAGFMMWRAERA